MAPGRNLSNTVDKQINDLVLAQVPLCEGLVILPQPFPKLRYRGLGQKKPAILVLKCVFDVAHRQTTRQHLDSEILEPLRVTLEMLANGRPERLIPPGDLWRRILHHALGRLQPTGPVAVAISPPRLRSMRIVVSTDDVTGFALKRLLDDQSDRQLDQFILCRCCGKTPFDQRGQLFSRAL